eukprot:860544-Rhodomonas_salina.1
MTSDDVDALLADAEQLSNPTALSYVAFEHCLHLPPTAAASFSQSLLVEEAACQHLAKAGYTALQHRLCTEAPARPDAVMPRQGETCGTSAVQGPQLAMHN